jgi:hypothetical protein
MLNETLNVESVLGRLRPRRHIEGMSAVLLPVGDAGQLNYDALAAHIVRTADTGLTPAVNMDTGYVDRLSPDQCAPVLRVAKAVLGNRAFVAGVFVEGQGGELVARYRTTIEAIESLGGTPILFQCSQMCWPAGLSIRLGCAAPSATAQPRHGLVSGCYALDPFYKGRDERQRLVEIKARRKEVS